MVRALWRRKFPLWPAKRLPRNPLPSQRYRFASLWTLRSGRGREPKSAIGSVLRAESLLARRYQTLFALREGRQLVFDGQAVCTVRAVGVYFLEQVPTKSAIKPSALPPDNTIDPSTAAPVLDNGGKRATLMLVSSSTTYLTGTGL